MVVLSTAVIGLGSASAEPHAEPNGRIIFSSCQPGGYCSSTEQRGPSADLYAIDLDTGARAQLTNTPLTFESEPAVSVDGDWLAYTRTTQGRSDHMVWLARTDGSRASQLTPRGSVSSNPTWLMNDFVYFTRGRYCSSIFRIRKGGGQVQGVLRATGSDESLVQPAITRDRRLAYGSADCEVRLDCCYLDVVDARGGKTSDLAKLPDLEVPGRPAWSPNGQLIAFDSGFDPGVVWVARRDGSHLRRISSRTLSASSPTWSPDGKWIAFEALASNADETDIYVARVDGSELRSVTKTKRLSESSPAWTR
jgi:Tol biopolymer transport system component